VVIFLTSFFFTGSRDNPFKNFWSSTDHMSNKLISIWSVSDQFFRHLIGFWSVLDQTLIKTSRPFCAGIDKDFHGRSQYLTAQRCIYFTLRGSRLPQCTACLHSSSKEITLTQRKNGSLWAKNLFEIFISDTPYFICITTVAAYIFFLFVLIRINNTRRLCYKETFQVECSTLLTHMM